MRKLPALTEKIAADPAKALLAAGIDPEAGRVELRDSDGRSAVRGLGMVVQPSGHRTWVLRYEIAGKPYKLTLGPYSEAMKLAAAREIAGRRKLEIAGGSNPAAEKTEARRKAAAGIDPDALFSTAWGDWEKAPKPKSRSKKDWRASTADRVAKLYTNELEPRWGKRRLSEIAKGDVQAYLNPIAKKHPHGAARRLRVIGSFFAWCVSQGRIDKSPCDGIEAVKPTKGKRKLTDAELRWLWKACDKVPFPFGYIVRLLILTLARRNEIARMVDREVHLGNRRTWILPAARAKNNHEHEVFLTDPMLAIIKAVPRVKNKAGYLFTTNGKTPFSGFSKAKRHLDALMLEVAQEEDPEITSIPNWTLHDLRRTSATRMQRLGFEKEIVDCCLNHIDDDEYLQHDYADSMVKAFDAWSSEVLRIVSGPDAPTAAG
ncbi:integrase arm-type DNA-binding domain-containing protein [Bradyrhizobium sp. 41S5]|uniref:tyrosine-type recombinase/integrase n=1 Tax=Bradyrhizobium sp. 41S5 TaxID=1404443 RepID=UPI00156BC549|nr:site-specific integrase [Bradyrhizobium sp. 41S5]UFX45217.1 integrase arm-type DNA-binding domain-containing protein [Bradyrhizobium sp. 41S5]